MYEILKKTAWGMEKIKPYGLIHISYFIVGIIISLLVAVKIKKISIKKLNKIILGFGIFLLICEVYKQLFYTYYIGNGSYQWWIFPFQLCSIPIYLCFIIPFVKNKKIYNTLISFLISYNLLGGFISFAEPSGLIHEYITLTIHAFLWHMSLVMLGVIVGFNKNIRFKIKDFKNVFYLFCILCLIALGINLIFASVSNNDINMFFIGPRISPIIIFKDIAIKYGWYVNSVIYIMVLTLGAFLMYLPFTKIKKITL